MKAQDKDTNAGGRCVQYLLRIRSDARLKSVFVSGIKKVRTVFVYEWVQKGGLILRVSIASIS